MMAKFLKIMIYFSVLTSKVGIRKILNCQNLRNASTDFRDVVLGANLFYERGSRISIFHESLLVGLSLTKK